jgi:hypothetical protein
MTLKQQKLIKALETSNSIAEAKIKAGYSPTSNAPYRKGAKRCIADAIHSNPLKISERFERIANKCDKEGDRTNEIRSTEALARINGMFIDKSEVKSTADVNLNERLTRLTHILSSNRIGNLLPAQAHCKPSADAMVDNVSAPNVSDNISLVSIIPSSNKLPLNIKSLLPLPIATSSPSIARKSMEGMGEGAVGIGKNIEKLPSESSPLLKVASPSLDVASSVAPVVPSESASLELSPKVSKGISKVAPKVKGAPLAEGEGHCFKCRVRRPISSRENIVMKNGLKALKGKCSICGTVMFKILKKDKV